MFLKICDMLVSASQNIMEEVNYYKNLYFHIDGPRDYFHKHLSLTNISPSEAKDVGMPVILFNCYAMSYIFVCILHFIPLSNKHLYEVLKLFIIDKNLRFKLVPDAYEPRCKYSLIKFAKNLSKACVF